MQLKSIEGLFPGAKQKRIVDLILKAQLPVFGLSYGKLAKSLMTAYLGDYKKLEQKLSSKNYK